MNTSGYNNCENEHFRDCEKSPSSALFLAKTLVLYLGTKPWDAADNLHDILDFSNISAEWKEYIQNYKIHVLDICHTPDERLLEFPDKIACMFLAIKHAGNKQRLSELINMFPFFHNLDEDTYDTIWNYVGNPKMLEIKKELETKKEELT